MILFTQVTKNEKVNKLNNTVPKRLKKLREQRGWSKSYVAKRLGFKGVSTYANWEYGLRSPDNEVISKLADIYDTTTDYILGRTENPDPPDKEEDSERDRMIHKLATEFPEADLMFEDLANMTAEELEEVYEFIKFKKSQGEKGGLNELPRKDRKG